MKWVPVNEVLQIVMHLGILGLFLLALADSSFLVLPFGIDLLLVILVAGNHHLAWKAVLIAAAGSVAGIFLLDLVCRKSGEAGLEHLMSRKRFEYLEQKMNERAAWAVALACIAPPPFPFMPVIAAASAFQYPRHKLLTVSFLSRLGRYIVVAVLAIIFGHEILKIVQSPPFFWAMIGFIALCAIGSAYSVFRWIRRGRKGKGRQESARDSRENRKQNSKSE